MNIKETKTEIQKIDEELALLFKKRMEAVETVSKAGAFDSAIETHLKEREIINMETKKIPEKYKLYEKLFFETVFSIARAYKSGFSENESHALSEIKSALIKGIKPFPISASVACQGVSGAYSQIAADKLFPLAEIMYFKDWNSVFSAVDKGLCDFGVLPIENSSVGSVNEVYDLMRKYNFFIARGIKLKVMHSLLAKRGADIKNIKEIYSHEQAIGQCSVFLNNLKDVKITVLDNTAKAAKAVSESDRDDVACIASKECAKIYGLSVLENNVQNSDNNFTRFIAISKKFEAYEDSNKISIMVNLPHEAGSLNSILNKFSTLGLNLTKIESRPIAGSVFEFAFYFDFEAKIEKREVQNLIAELDNTCEKFVFLGSYLENN